jgi:hypothetical protein
MVTCDVYDYKKIITDEVIADGGTFIWKRVSNSATADSEWKPTYIDGKPNQIIISVDDIEKNSQFYCEVDFDETKFTNENEETGIIE